MSKEKKNDQKNKEKKRKAERLYIYPQKEDIKMRWSGIICIAHLTGDAEIGQLHIAVL